jgi:thiamine biosynthesis lipoprotein
MGTAIAVDLWDEDEPRGRALTQAVIDEMHRIDDLMSTYKPGSELSRINARAADEAMPVSPELLALIQRALDFSRLTEGAFDITYASAGQYYDYREGIRPSSQQLAQALPAIDYHHVRIDPQAATIRFLYPGVRIDLGGIAKGYAVDRAIDLLRQCGINRAMVSAGGDSRIIGDHDGRPWIIGVQHPRDPDGIALRLPLSDTAVSTSGDYERYFFDNGERIHHIINPKTGRSASASWSATVIGPDAMTTDALSTTIFVLGAVEGLALVESLAGIDAIIIDSNGKVHYSSGFQDPSASE